MSRMTAAGTAAAALALVLLGGGPAAGTGLHDDDPSPTPGPAATDHSAHSGHAEEPAVSGHDDHGADDDGATDDHSTHDDGTAGAHGGEADSVSTRTRLAVLGGFGAVNAAVVGTAFVLRRRGRRTGRARRAGR